MWCADGAGSVTTSPADGVGVAVDFVLVAAVSSAPPVIDSPSSLLVSGLSVSRSTGPSTASPFSDFSSKAFWAADALFASGTAPPPPRP